MKLIRNTTPDGRGKYALVRLDKLRALQGLGPKHAQQALLDLEALGLLEYGEKGSKEEFFAIKLKDQNAAAALFSYAKAVAQWQPEDRQFVPWCQKWMNKRRWLDDPATWCRAKVLPTNLRNNRISNDLVQQSNNIAAAVAAQAKARQKQLRRAGCARTFRMLNGERSATSNPRNSLLLLRSMLQSGSAIHSLGFTNLASH